MLVQVTDYFGVLILDLNELDSEFLGGPLSIHLSRLRLVEQSFDHDHLKCFLQKSALIPILYKFEIAETVISVVKNL